MKTFLSVLVALVVAEVLRAPIRKGIVETFEALDDRDRDALWARQRAKGATGFSWTGGKWHKWQTRLGFLK